MTGHTMIDKGRCLDLGRVESLSKKFLLATACQHITEFVSLPLMLQAQPVTSFDEPALEPYRTMKWQTDHQRQNIFVAEGEKVVRRLLESDLTVHSLLLPEKWLIEYEPLLARRPETIRAFTAEKPTLEKLTGFSMYQGVLAVATVPEPTPLAQLLTPQKTSLMLLAVDGLSNAENLGGIIRTCAAFGVDALIVGETCCHPYLRRSVRGSMGAIFKLPYILSQNLSATLQELHTAGVYTVAAHPHTNQQYLDRSNLQGSCCIILGSEGEGVSPQILATCRATVAIPMRNEIDSLNAGNAAAVFLYEVYRQRQKISLG